MDDVIDNVAKGFNEQLERELWGAWRAGYDYLHVYSNQESMYEPSESFSISMLIFPAYSEKPPKPGDLIYHYTYVLEDDVFQSHRLNSSGSEGK